MDLLGQLVAHRGEIFHRLFDAVAVVALEGVLKVVKRAFDVARTSAADLFAIFLERLFGLEDEILALVFQVDGLAAFFVLGGVQLGFVLHALDLFLGEAAAVLDRDLAFLAGAFVLGG